MPAWFRNQCRGIGKMFGIRNKITSADRPPPRKRMLRSLGLFLIPRKLGSLVLSRSLACVKIRLKSLRISTLGDQCIRENYRFRAPDTMFVQAEYSLPVYDPFALL